MASTFSDTKVCRLVIIKAAIVLQYFKFKYRLVFASNGPNDTVV